MKNDSKFTPLALRVRQTFGDRPLSKAFEDRKAIIGPGNFPGTDEGKLAEKALNDLENNLDADPKGLAALELMIKLMRPAPCITGGKFDPIDSQAAATFPTWAAFCEAFRPFEFSVGRISDASGKGVGTGFLINDEIVSTNAHVVDFLSRGTMLLTEGQASIDFRKEYQDFVADTVPILQVIAVHKSSDLALLRVHRVDDKTHVPVQMGDNDPVSNDALVALGYPYDDPARNPLFVSGIYNGIFGVKRAAPGKVVSVEDGEITHDCSTLGGNSGSPMLSMVDARVAAVHSEGMFMYVNRAVPVSILKDFSKTNA